MNISNFTPKQRKNDMYVVYTTKLHMFCYVPFGVRYIESFDSHDDLMEFCEQHGVVPDMTQVTN